MTVTRASLLAAAHSLCDDFAAKSDVGTLLSHFSTTHTCVAIEHGEPVLAPFLGRLATVRSKRCECLICHRILQIVQWPRRNQGLLHSFAEAPVVPGHVLLGVLC
jgi:hypothetical protein